MTRRSASTRCCWDYVPGTNIRLGRMRGGEHQHRPGVDITLSAPKSVSLAALLHGDRRVIRAHDEAVRAALDFVEAELLQTRGWDPVARRRSSTLQAAISTRRRDILEIEWLVGLGLTRTQKVDIANYRPSDMLAFHNDTLPYRVVARPATSRPADQRRQHEERRRGPAVGAVPAECDYGRLPANPAARSVRRSVPPTFRLSWKKAPVIVPASPPVRWT